MHYVLYNNKSTKAKSQKLLNRKLILGLDDFLFIEMNVITLMPQMNAVQCV